MTPDPWGQACTFDHLYGDCDRSALQVEGVGDSVDLWWDQAHLHGLKRAQIN